MITEADIDDGRELIEYNPNQKVYILFDQPRRVLLFNVKLPNPEYIDLFGYKSFRILEQVKWVREETVRGFDIEPVGTYYYKAVVDERICSTITNYYTMRSSNPKMLIRYDCYVYKEPTPLTEIVNPEQYRVEEKVTTIRILVKSTDSVNKPLFITRLPLPNPNFKSLGSLNWRKSEVPRFWDYPLHESDYETEASEELIEQLVEYYRTKCGYWREFVKVGRI